MFYVNKFTIGKLLRSMTLGCKYKGIRKLECVTKAFPLSLKMRVNKPWLIYELKKKESQKIYVKV